MPMPAAASRSTSTSCPCETSSRAPAGVRPTRYSCVLISFGTPILTPYSSCRKRKLPQVGQIVLLDVDAQRGQHAHDGIVEGDRKDKVNEAFRVEVPRQRGER